MNVEFDNELRDTLGEIAAEARPVTSGLAEAALRTGRRRHAARRSLTGLAVAALVAAVLTPTLVLGHRTAPTGPASGTTPSSMPSKGSPPTSEPRGKGHDIKGWFLAGGPGSHGALVWSRAEQRYVTLPVDHAWPAPTGDLVITQIGHAMTLRHIGGGEVASLPGGDAIQVNWNTDGSRALYTLLSARPKTVIVDAAHHTAQTLDLGTECFGLVCVGSSWLTGTDRFTALGWDVEAGPGNLTVFDTTGHKLDTITGGAMAGADLSADQRYIVEDQTATVRTAVVRDRSTGTVARLDEQNLDVRTVRWIDTTHFIGLTQGRVIEFGIDGHAVASIDWPDGFSEGELPTFTLAKR